MSYKCPEKKGFFLLKIMKGLETNQIQKLGGITRPGMTARARTHWGLNERKYPIIQNRQINFVVRPDENTADCNCCPIFWTDGCLMIYMETIFIDKIEK